MNVNNINNCSLHNNYRYASTIPKIVSKPTLMEKSLSQNLLGRIQIQAETIFDDSEYLVPRDELLRLFIYIRQLRKEPQGKQFECYVIEREHLVDFVKNMLENTPKDGNLRLGVLVRNSSHYLGI